MADIPFAIQKTEDEVQKMTPAERAAYDELQRKIVYGHDSKVDDEGNPVEQGIGSAQQPTRNSIEAYKRWHGPKSQDPDADFEENLKRMEAEYAAYVAANKARRAARAA